jgi:ABC-type lipoprotein release transport system permease subunit
MPCNGVFCVWPIPDSTLPFRIVTQRARQIGICMALGATSSRVVRETARQGLVPIVVGLVIGAPLALGAGYVVTASASLCPAMRAAKIDPAVTLRHESSG